MNQIATAIGRDVNLPVRGITAAKAHDHFGCLGSLAPMDNPTSAAITATCSTGPRSRPASSPTSTGVTTSSRDPGGGGQFRSAAPSAAPIGALCRAVEADPARWQVTSVAGSVPLSR